MSLRWIRICGVGPSRGLHHRKTDCCRTNCHCQQCKHCKRHISDIGSFHLSSLPCPSLLAVAAKIWNEAGATWIDFGGKRRRQIVSSALKARAITLTLQSGNRIGAETSSNAAAGFCRRETMPGNSVSRETLRKELNIRPDHSCHIPDVCRAFTLIFLRRTPYKSPVCKGKALQVHFQSACSTLSLAARTSHAQQAARRW